MSNCYNSTITDDVGEPNPNDELFDVFAGSFEAGFKEESELSTPGEAGRVISSGWSAPSSVLRNGMGCFLYEKPSSNW